MNPETPISTPKQPSQEPIIQPLPAQETAYTPNAPQSPVQQPVTEPVGQPQATIAGNDPGRGLGIASLILSIFGFSLVGIILGFVAISKSKKAGLKGNTLGLVGVIIGFVSMILSILILVGLVMNNFQGAQAKARDTASVTRMNEVHSQLEAYHNENNAYPQTLSVSILPGISPSALQANNGATITSGGSGLKTEAEALSMSDPDAQTPYQYIAYGCADEKCKGYILRVRIEKPTTNFPDPYQKIGLNN